MAFAIAKRAHDGESAIYVTAIKRCWSSIDNVRIWDNRLNMESWKVRIVHVLVNPEYGADYYQHEYL